MKSLDDKLKEIPLEVLNEITVQTLTGYENAQFNSPSENGKKGGKSRSEAKIRAAKANMLKAQQSYDYEELMRRAHLGGQRGGKKGGDKARDMNLGIHSLTKEQQSENAKKGQSIVRECPHCRYTTKGAAIFIAHFDKCFMIGKDKVSFDTQLLKYGGITHLSNLYNISYTTLSNYQKFLKTGLSAAEFNKNKNNG
jgi:hypothetical protein